MVLGISFDKPADNAAFVQKYSFPFAILSDVDRSVAQAIGAATDPKAAYANRNTVVIGPDGRIEKILEKVNAKTHPGELLAALKSAPAAR